MPYYTITIQSFYSETPHEITEGFDNINDCIEFCKEHYRFALWCLINGKTIAVDNTIYYKSNKKPILK